MAASQSSDPEPSLFNDNVQFVGLNSVPEETSSTTRELPLFCLGQPFYPEGITYLNVFEMKYRNMMFDIAKSDDCLGYIQVDDKYGIALVGSLCKVTERELLEDGRQIITLQGVERFRVRKITKTLPYIVAEVESIEDEKCEDIKRAINLENEVYSYLKFYIRLFRMSDSNKGAVISHAAKRSRPTRTNFMDEDRRSKFSLSLGNMIQLGARESQLMLQTTDVMKRLRAQRDILKNVIDYATKALIEDKVVTASTVDELKTKTFTRIDDDDSDILPPDESEMEATEEKDEWDLSNIE